MEASYLKKLTVTGIHKKSEINFNKGLNIITGPSNVGKTCIVKCIDYLTGSSSLPFSPSTHYNTITLEISVDDSLVILSRNLEEDTIIVESTLPSILSGEYYSKNKSKNK
ncbi:AAA family ATPase, partial [Streptococcus mitis]